MAQQKATRVWLIVCTALLALALAGTLAGRGSPAFAEWYSTTVYPVLVRTVGGFFGLLPFSAGELLIYAAVLLALAGLVWVVAAALRKSRPLKKLLTLGKLFALLLGLILFLFTFHCGINYHRVPFSALAGFSVRPSSQEELAALCEELIRETNAAGSHVLRDEEGAMASPDTPLTLSRRGVAAMERLGERYPALAGYYPPAKPILFSKGFSYLDLLGVYFPPTIEANFNSHAPDYELPATICHELSHLRGFMREDEANFIAYLVCRDSEDSAFLYSGLMLALVHSMNALYESDSELYFALYERYGQGIKQDISTAARYWRQFDGPAAAVSQMANDVYLKVNAQPDGVKSYGRMVDLLLADYRARHRLP